MSEPFADSKPRKGEHITYEGRVAGVVHSVEGNLCWTSYDGRDPAPFIWRFKDGLNALHSWPSKQPHHPLTFCPGVTP